MSTLLYVGYWLKEETRQDSQLCFYFLTCCIHGSQLGHLSMWLAVIDHPPPCWIELLNSWRSHFPNYILWQIILKLTSLIIRDESWWHFDHVFCFWSCWNQPHPCIWNCEMIHLTPIRYFPRRHKISFMNYVRFHFGQDTVISSLYIYCMIFSTAIANAYSNVYKWHILYYSFFFFFTRSPCSLLHFSWW